MRGKRVGRNEPIAHGAKDFDEVLPRRVAAAEQRDLARMKLRVGEGDGVAHDADQHIGPAVRDIVEPGGHGAGLPGGVDDDVEKVAARELRQGFQRAAARHDGVIDPENVTTEVEAVLPHIQRGHRSVAELGEDHAAGADRTRPDDEDAIAFLRVGPAHCMGADRKELDHRRLVERHAVGRGHIALRHADIVGHPAVDMDAEDGDALTAIGLAAPAGDADAAGQVWDDEDLLAHRRSCSPAPSPPLRPTVRVRSRADIRERDASLRRYAGPCRTLRRAGCARAPRPAPA